MKKEKQTEPQTFEIVEPIGKRVLIRKDDDKSAPGVPRLPQPESGPLRGRSGGGGARAPAAPRYNREKTTHASTIS